MRTLNEKKLLMLRPDDIKTGLVTTRERFDEYELYRLSESISENGIIEPIAVRKCENGYELIAGERRLKAAKMAGLRRVPCVLHRADCTAAMVMSISENTHRSDPDFFEQAAAIERLIQDSKITQAEAATRLSISQSALCNKLRLLRLTEEQRRRITAASLTERHARALLRLEECDRDKLLDRIIAEGLSLAQTEDAINAFLNPDESTALSAPTRKAAIGDPRIFANSVGKLIATIQNAGFEAYSRRSETDKYIEYRVRINKVSNEKYTQLKIC